MRPQSPLPRRLGETFRISDADVAGVRRWRRDVPEPRRPFPGIRTTQDLETLRQVAEAYAPRLRPGQRFCGETAARLWGLPVPWPWDITDCLEVAVPRDAARPRPVAVRGRRLDADRGPTCIQVGLPVLHPVATVLTLAPRLTTREMAVMLDALVSDSRNYPGLQAAAPLASLHHVAAMLAHWGRFPGVLTVREAIGLVREHVESPKETETRLTIIEAGLPEPVVQYVIMDGDRRVAKVDLAYPHLKIAIEYEGDGHRVDKMQWREDIRRQRELEALGWIVIRVTARDLATGRLAFLAHLRRAMAR